MIQIWVSDSITQPFVSRVDGELPQLNVSATMSFQEIKSYVWEDLTDTEWEAVYRLWADDSTDRKFSKQNEKGDFLIEFR